MLCTECCSLWVMNLLFEIEDKKIFEVVKCKNKNVKKIETMTNITWRNISWKPHIFKHEYLLKVTTEDVMDIQTAGKINWYAWWLEEQVMQRIQHPPQDWKAYWQLWGWNYVQSNLSKMDTSKVNQILNLIFRYL